MIILEKIRRSHEASSMTGNTDSDSMKGKIRKKDMRENHGRGRICCEESRNLEEDDEGELTKGGGRGVVGLGEERRGMSLFIREVRACRRGKRIKEWRGMKL